MMKQKMLVNSMSNVESATELRLMLLTLNFEGHKLSIGPLNKYAFSVYFIDYSFPLLT